MSSRQIYVRSERGTMQILRVIQKFRRLLSSRQKARIALLAGLMVVGGFLEMLSVSLLLPFMDAVMEPEAAMGRWYVRLFCQALDLHSPRTFLIALSLVMAVVYVFKNAYLMLEYRVQYRFVYGNMFAMQSELLQTFLHRPYEYYLGINSGEMIRLVSNDTAQTFLLLQVLLQLFTELVVSAALIATIFFIAPFITLCMAAALLALVLVIHRGVKPRLRNVGTRTQRATASMNKWLLQSIQGIKELMVMGKEPYFQRKFDESGWERVLSLRQYSLLSTLPRFLIEAGVMSAMFGVMGFLIYRGQDLETMVPVLTAVAMAAVRLLPSVNRITSALASISYSEPMLDKTLENLRGMGKAETSRDARPPEHGQGASKIGPLRESLQVRDVDFRYPGRAENVLTRASLTVRRGESVGIVGPSGAGKSTLMDVVLGLLRPQAGAVLVDGTDIREDLSGWMGQIGYIPQAIFLLDDTIRANVAFGVDPAEMDEARVWASLREAALDAFVSALPDGLDTQIGERGLRLSGGQRQRVGIARALYAEPSILIFDEATSALDNDTEKEIMASIQRFQGNKTMLIIAHRLTTIEGCDHIYKVENQTITPVR